MKGKILLITSLFSVLALASCEGTETIVETIPLESLSITSEVSEVAIGETIKLTAVTTPTNATETITWVSSNESIATVDSEGNVTGVSLGEVTIIAMGGSFTATIDLEVTPNWDTVISDLQGTLSLEGRLVQSYYSGDTLSFSYTSDLVTYISEDRYVSIEVDADSGSVLYEYRYVRGEDDTTYREYYLNYDNTVYKEGPYSNAFSESYYNPFGVYELSAADFVYNSDNSATLTLPLEDGEEDGEVTYMLTGGYEGYTNTINLTLADDGTLAGLSLVGVTTSWTYEVRNAMDFTVVDPYESGAIILPYESTEESERLQAVFDKVNEGNYTANMHETYWDWDFYVEATESTLIYYDYDYGYEWAYIDTDTGLDNVRVRTSGSTTTLTGTGTKDPYRTVSDYTPKLLVAAELFDYLGDDTWQLKDDFVDYLYLSVIDVLVYDWAYYVTSDVILTLSEDDSVLTIEYDYYFSSRVNGTITTTISDMGETSFRYADAEYTPSAEYVVPTSWSEYSSSLVSTINSRYGIDLDNIPFVNRDEYHAELGLGYYTSYFVLQPQFEYTDDGYYDLMYAYFAYVAKLEEEGWSLADSRYTNENYSNLSIGLAYGSSSSSGLYLLNISVYVS